MGKRGAIAIVIIGVLSVGIALVAATATPDAPPPLELPDPLVHRTAAPEPTPEPETMPETMPATMPSATVATARPESEPLVPAPEIAAGPTRRVRGFIVDFEGEPVVDAVVRMHAVAGRDGARAARDGAGPDQVVLSDERGAFSFVTSTHALRFDADAGTRGHDQAWVARGEADDQVELVLEPVGTIMVTSDSAAFASIRASDARSLAAVASETEADAVAVVEAAEAEIGVPITLPANIWYEVVLVDGDEETLCARVALRPGQVLVLACDGAPQEAIVSGVVVDRDGFPVPNLALWYRLRDPIGEHQDGVATTDGNGRFSIALSVSRPGLFDLGAGSESVGVLMRRNVVVTPGSSADVGAVLWMDGEDRPEPWPSGAYGGIGGLVSFSDDGVTIIDMEHDSPLYLAGVEPNDTIVMVDGRPASEMPDEEALVLLRGDPGTAVDLRIRSAAGDLYQLTLERKLMGAPSETWGDGGDSGDGRGDGDGDDTSEVENREDAGSE